MQQNGKGDEMRRCRGEIKIGGATGSSGPKYESDQDHPAMPAQDDLFTCEDFQGFPLVMINKRICGVTVSL